MRGNRDGAQRRTSDPSPDCAGNSRLLHSLLHRGLGLADPQWYGLARRLRESPAQRYEKARNGTREEPWNRAHNPKVAGSNPAPATIEHAGQAPLLGVGPSVVRARRSDFYCASTVGFRECPGQGVIVGPPTRRSSACRAVHQDCRTVRLVVRRWRAASSSAADLRILSTFAGSVRREVVASRGAGLLLRGDELDELLEPFLVGLHVRTDLDHRAQQGLASTCLDHKGLVPAGKTVGLHVAGCAVSSFGALSRLLVTDELSHTVRSGLPSERPGVCADNSSASAKPRYLSRTRESRSERPHGPLTRERATRWGRWEWRSSRRTRCPAGRKSCHPSTRASHRTTPRN